MPYPVPSRLWPEERVSDEGVNHSDLRLVILSEVEDVVTATELLLDVEMGPGVPPGGLLGAMEDELIETLEE